MGPLAGTLNVSCVGATTWIMRVIYISILPVGAASHQEVTTASAGRTALHSAERHTLHMRRVFLGNARWSMPWFTSRPMYRPAPGTPVESRTPLLAGLRQVPRVSGKGFSGRLVCRQNHLSCRLLAMAVGVAKVCQKNKSKAANPRLSLSMGLSKRFANSMG